MNKSLPKTKKLIPIREAAEFLGVSIDTIRRWDRLGMLHSQRPGGKTRYFSVEELERIKSSGPSRIIGQNKEKTFQLVHFRGIVYRAGLWGVKLFILLVIIMIILFLLWPEQTAKLLLSFM